MNAKQGEQYVNIKDQYKFSCKISGFHSSFVEDSGLWICDAMFLD
jgi:hypothetical protein